MPHVRTPISVTTPPLRVAESERPESSRSTHRYDMIDAMSVSELPDHAIPFGFGPVVDDSGGAYDKIARNFLEGVCLAIAVTQWIRRVHVHVPIVFRRIVPVE